MGMSTVMFVSKVGIGVVERTVDDVETDEKN
jgi:hypothetical protein